METLLGDPTKARKQLGWAARTPFLQLVKEMVAVDLETARRSAVLKEAGYEVRNPQK